jgi:uncharacterized protein YbjT (DUF2867 family)
VRIFLAGASGVIGVRLVPLLVAAGHDVAGMTRSAAKIEHLLALGAEPVLCDVYDSDALTAAVQAFHPDMVMHQLTDLPDDISQIAGSADRNDRMRREGTHNLLVAAQVAVVNRFSAQSIAWDPPAGRAVATREFEKSVLDAGGVVIRYGRLYGPDTYYPTEPPPPPRIHIDHAARRTATTLDAPTGIIELVD